MLEPYLAAARLHPVLHATTHLGYMFPVPGRFAVGEHGAWMLDLVTPREDLGA
ncbi:MAG: hypothetical protein ACOYD0_00265 [Candidatus Nanopelagicales bacterium]